MSETKRPRGSSSGMGVRRAISNRIARYLISIGGVSVIAVVVAIFLFIAYETLPLWQGGELIPSGKGLPGIQNKALLAGINEYGTTAFTLLHSGTLLPIDLSDSLKQAPDPIHLQSEGSEILMAADYDVKGSLILAVDSTFLFRLSKIGFTYSPIWGYADKPPVTVEDLWSGAIDSLGAISRVRVRQHSSDETVILVESERKGRSVLTELTVNRVSTFYGDEDWEITANEITSLPGNEIGAIAVDRDGRKVVAGTTDGTLLYWDARNNGAEGPARELVVSPGVGVSAIEFLSGGQAIVIGTVDGAIKSFTWVLDPTSESGISLVPLNTFEGHKAAVTAISTSLRNKSFLTGDASGEIAMHYQTTGETLDRRAFGDTGVSWVMLAPKSDGLIALFKDNSINVSEIVSPHPEVTLSVLFGKVQYEGYAEPSYTWQSTGGTDDFEPKLSLTPLLVGTLKGALYALIFALPVAILAAIYTALFSHPKIKNFIKPTVEVMAALPSVVIGFIGALWLAPFLEHMLVAVVLMGIVLPVGFFASAGLWHVFPKKWVNRWPAGSELSLIIPGIVGAVLVAIALAGPVEAAFFGGNARQWLFETMGITYDQRNSIVVGFAMGFAVIPIIFTISEDALSSVPEHLTAGSLALGATRWQTAIRVVLPTASPGIFSAAMVGFGRAVGETMIVLMATGNTPVMDLSPFVGMRTLSANIAVEIPEAPYLGTLYRVLFVSGLLLFAFTFAVNTVAEIVRQRLRRKYSTI